MTVSVDGFIEDREGGIGWTVPDAELFGFHLARVRELGGILIGRRLYETMKVWETDPSLRGTPDESAFADVWSALPKVVFSRSSPHLIGNARLATASLSEELATMRAGTHRDLEVGGAELASAALELDLVDELRIFRYPVVLGAGTPYLPPLEHPLVLSLVETRAFPSGVVYERLRRVRPETA